jgi:hypothetical protein
MVVDGLTEGAPPPLDEEPQLMATGIGEIEAETLKEPA